MEPELARQNLLSAARARLHIRHELDVTGVIAAQNACVGIGKIIHALEYLGIRGDVNFVASLDFTITRHAGRWGSGFSYGGALEVTTDGNAIAFPEIRPNTCGTILGVMNTIISTTELISRVCDARNARTGSFDYSRKNHFINVYRSTTTDKRVFIIHGCPGNVRLDTVDGPGLYLETSNYWRARALSIDTPLGPLQPLVGEHAVAYWENYQRCEANSKADRLAIAKVIFDDFEVMANHTHEGMLAPQVYLHGCHAAATADLVFPVMSSMGEPAFLVSRDVESPVIWNNVAVLPHGTGYSIQVPARNFEMRYISERDRIFLGSGAAHQEAYSSFEEVPFIYRSNQHVHEWASRRMLSIRDVLLPEVFLKL